MGYHALVRIMMTELGMKKVRWRINLHGLKNEIENQLTWIEE